jgi:NAD(P)H-dependent flavin oxidoreductase YrpB (nitropropane dioxygenase family)
MYVDAAQGAENVVISTEFAYNADCGAEDLSRAPYTIEAVYKPSN